MSPLSFSSHLEMLPILSSAVSTPETSFGSLSLIPDGWLCCSALPSEALCLAFAFLYLWIVGFDFFLTRHMYLLPMLDIVRWLSSLCTQSLLSASLGAPRIPDIGFGRLATPSPPRQDLCSTPHSTPEHHIPLMALFTVSRTCLLLSFLMAQL